MFLVDNYNSTQQCLDAAGSDAEIGFTSGKIYEVSLTLVGKPGQKWRSTGADPAILRRCNEIKSDLTQPALSTSTIVFVRNPQQFTVGQQITFVKNKPLASHDDGDIQANWIQFVGIDSVTLSKPPKGNFSVGDWLLVSQPIAIMQGGAAKVDNLIFDGNREDNNTYCAWEYQSSLVLQNVQGATVSACKFIDGQGESLMLNDVSDSLITECSFSDGNGSGVHLSTTKNLKIGKCEFYRMNQQHERTQHAEAAITFSWKNSDVDINNNEILDGWAWAIGRIVAVNENRYIRIFDNIIERNQGVLDVKGGGANYPTTGLDLNLAFTRNTVKNSGDVNLYEYTGKLRVAIVSENVITGGRIVAMGIDNLVVGENATDNMNTPLTAIEATGCNDVTVSANTVTGGYRGIVVRTKELMAYPSYRNILVVGNDVQATLDLALSVGDPIYTWYEDPTKWQTDYAECRDILVTGNSFVSDKIPTTKALVHLGKGLKAHGPVFLNNTVDSSGVGIFVEGHQTARSTKAAMLRYNSITSVGAKLKSYMGYDKDIEVV